MYESRVSVFHDRDAGILHNREFRFLILIASLRSVCNDSHLHTPFLSSHNRIYNVRLGGGIDGHLQGGMGLVDCRFQQ